MKIGTPELKTKPATKYFDHGYIQFKTEVKILSYRIVLFDRRKNPFLFSGWREVRSEQHLKDLFAIKSVNEVVEVLS